VEITIQLELILRALALTCLLQLMSLMGTGLAVIAARRQWIYSFNLFIFTSIAIGSIVLLMFSLLMFGGGRKDPMDGLAIMFFMMFLGVTFLGLMVAGIVLIFVDKKSTHQKSPPLYPFFLSAAIFALTFIAAYAAPSKMPTPRLDLESSQERIRYAFENTKKFDEFSVYLGLGQNPQTPPDILEVLSSYEHPAIRAQVAHNPNSPDLIVEKLSRDENKCIASIAVREMSRRKGLTDLPETSCR
jgi:hypothetical protein